MKVGVLFSLLLCLAVGRASAASLTVDGTLFRLNTNDGRVLRSPDLVGAVLDMAGPDGKPATLRIDRVESSRERPEVLLHDLSAKGPDGVYRPICDADAQGRLAAFPVAGAIDAHGRYTRAPGKWYLTCTSGAQGKCILWGYDPWSRGPHGEDLASRYQACMHMVRGDYDGAGEAHTKNGTSIDVWDDIGVEDPAAAADPTYSFEAGWGPNGAVCVAHTRWADILPLDRLFAATPGLRASPCNEAEARRRGALIYNRSRGR